MAKPSQGRFDGVWGMRKFTTEQLFAWADQHEARITDPTNTDDPKWLQRRADRLRRVAVAKENALEVKRRGGDQGNQTVHWTGCSVGHSRRQITIMATSAPKPVPENAPGDFYVQADCCMGWCLVHNEAPELMNDCSRDFRECYFQRQPQTPEEVEQAIRAISVSEVAALRYGGTDQAIIRRLHKLHHGHCCDQPLTPWWRRLFGSAR